MLFTVMCFHSFLLRSFVTIIHFLIYPYDSLHWLVYLVFQSQSHTQSQVLEGWAIQGTAPRSDREAVAMLRTHICWCQVDHLLWRSVLNEVEFSFLFCPSISLSCATDLYCVFSPRKILALFLAPGFVLAAWFMIVVFKKGPKSTCFIHADNHISFRRTNCLRKMNKI